MPLNALIAGGCPAPYHRIEAAEPPLHDCLASLDYTVRTTGIYHPDGGDSFTGDYSALTDEGLSGIDLLLLYTTGNTRYGADVEAVTRFVERGGALIGVHNAADSFTDSPEFVRLVGARFRTHPAQLDITTEPVDPAHPIMRGVDTFTVFDELYLFADYDAANVHLLAQTHSYDDGGPVPIAWTREQGAGRVFYISLGHNASTLADPSWQHLFKQGVLWASGREPKN